MKSNKITLCLMLLITFFIGCKKENVENVTKNSEQQVTEKLLDFKSKLNAKNLDYLSSDSASWYLEGVLNYEMANNNHNISNLSFNYDTTRFDYPANALTYAQLETIYSVLKKQINNHLSEVPESLCDIINLKIQPVSNGINVYLVSSIGSKVSKYLYTQFGTEDYWTWGGNHGKCDGSYAGQDACDQLRIRFNSPLNKPYIEGYYTGVVCVNEYYNSHPLSTSQYRMFISSGPGSTPSVVCISPNQLNFYLGNFDYIKDINCPIGKQFKNVNVLEDYATMDNYWMIAHLYKLYYGTFVPGASQQ